MSAMVVYPIREMRERERERAKKEREREIYIIGSFSSQIAPHIHMHGSPETERSPRRIETQLDSAFARADKMSKEERPPSNTDVSRLDVSLAKARRGLWKGGIEVPTFPSAPKSLRSGPAP